MPREMYSDTFSICVLSVSLTQKVSLFQGAAVFLDGQAGWPVPTDPDRQNWKSGISWIGKAWKETRMKTTTQFTPAGPRLKSCTECKGS